MSRFGRFGGGIIHHDLGDNGSDNGSDNGDAEVKVHNGGNFKLDVATANAGDLAAVAALEVLNDNKAAAQAKADAAKNKKGNNDEDKAPQTAPLTADELSRGIARLAPISVDASDFKTFNKRESSMKAPKTGELVSVPFPPPAVPREEFKMDAKTLEALGQVESGEIKIERTTPMQGSRLTQPFSSASITFNQPMIAVAALEEVKAEHAGLGITMTPEQKGDWRWTGTQTLQFVAEHRFKYATNYTIKVPRSLTSAIGGELKAEFELKFSTSPVKIISSQPGGTVQTLKPHVFVLFDQDIDVAAVAKLITVTGGLTVANGGLIITDRQVGAAKFKKQIRKGRENRWLAFEFKADLKPATSYTVTFPTGTPSAEGPLPTVVDQVVQFRTYDPFTVTATYPDLDTKWHGPATPGSEFSVTFSNDIKLSTATKDLFHWTPALPGFAVQAKGSHLTIYNHSKANSTYKLTIDRKVTDIHGQPLSGRNEITFKTGAEVLPEGRLQGPSGIITLDPILKPASYPLLITNIDEIDISIYRVDPWHSMANWSTYHSTHWTKYEKEHSWIPDKLRVHHETKKFAAEQVLRDEPFEYRVDVSKYLQDVKEQVGQVVVVVLATPAAHKRTQQGSNDDFKPMAAAWLQVTKLSLDPFQDGRPGNPGVIGWVNDLRTGHPIAGATVIHRATSHASKDINVAPNSLGVTNAQGLVRIRAKQDAMGHGEACPLVAMLGSDIVFLSGYQVWNNRGQDAAWFVFDDRQLYKPKETVSVKGYVRRLERKGEACTPTYVTGEVEYTVKDPRGQELVKKKTTLSAFGSFDFSFELKDNVNLGSASIELYKVFAKGSTEPKIPIHYHSFKIQEYRKPEFKAAATHRPSAGAIHVTSIAGGVVVADVAATYFAGGPLTDANVNWRVNPSRGSYAPPTRSKFTFEKYKPWWRYVSDEEPTLAQVEGVGKTDGTGTHQLKINYGGIPNPPVPVVITATASVRDKNNQTIEAATNFIVHPCHYYIGHAQSSNFGKKGEASVFDVVVAAVDGTAVAGIPFVVTIKGEGSERVEDAKTGMVEWKKVLDERTFNATSEKDEFKFSFTPAIGGNYSITFDVSDTTGGKHRSSREFYVSGGFSEIKSQKVDRVPQQQLELVANKQKYQPGETAELLIVSPFSPAQGFVVISCEGICGTPIPITIPSSSNSATASFVVSADWIPGFEVQAELVGEAPRSNADGVPDATQPSRPAFARGQVTLEIPLLYHTIDVAVSPKDTTQQSIPGAGVTVRVVAKGRDGKPLPNAEVAIVMVDEAVLSLTGYRVDNPVAQFYPRRYGGYDRQSVRSSCILVSTDELERLRKEAEEKKAAEKKQREAAASQQDPFDGEGGDFDGGIASLSSLGAMPAGAMSFGAPQSMMMRTSGKEGASGGKPRGMMLMKKSARTSTATSTTMALDDMSAGGGGGGGGYGAAPEDTSPIAVRSNFNPLASFHPQARTDAKGEASIEVKLPDSLTSYRVWAVVVNDKSYGIGESTLEVQLPVMIRPSPPRFLNFGDKASISVVIQNQTAQPLEVRVGLRASNAAIVGDALNGGVKFTLGGAKRHAVTFPVTTTMPGTARFQFFVTAPGFSDAAEVSLPVFTPATSEAFATYGDVDEKSVVLQPVRAPTDAFAEFGGLEISTSSTALQSLTDAVLYLWSYQYECAEQLSSRLLGVLALRDVLQAFAVKALPTAAELKAKLASDLIALQGKQHGNGGFGWWSGSSSDQLPNLFVSIHGAAALAAAVDKKVEVPATLLEKSTRYVTEIEDRIREYEAFYRYALDIKTRNGLIAYALYVRTKLGVNVSVQAQALWTAGGADHSNLSLEAIGWLSVALSKGVIATIQPTVDAIRTFLFTKVNETAETANFITSYGDDGQSVMLHSNRRTDAALLEGLLFIDPTNKLNPKIAKGLLAHRVKGAWNSTQENCFILLALDKYFHVFEKDVPDFISRIWIGDDFAGEQTFKGRSTVTNKLDIPMTYLMAPETTPSESVAAATGAKMLAIQKEGKGRLYYRIGLNYAPTSLALLAVNYGFKVDRTYSGVDDAKHVTRDSAGVWHFKLGEKIKVNLTMVTTTRRYHVALCDYLPAGIEPLNPELKGNGGELTSSVSRSRGFQNPWSYRWYQRRDWPEHTNLRDERAEAFRSLLWEGVYEWSYTARATTVGTFIAPPTKAEEMYSPENFGRSATDRVVVEE